MRERHVATPTTTTTEATAAKKPRNGFAVAALIFGILGGVLFGLLFGFMGLARARKVGTGKGMAWAGILFSLLWIVGGAAVFVTVGPNLLKAANPGCIAAKDVLATTSKLTAGGDNLRNDLVSVANGLEAAAARSTDADATKAIKDLADDYQEFVDAIDGDASVGADLNNRLRADTDAVNRACGTIGA
jgi:hypothetical protein